jgi:acyl carrier protein
VGLSIGKGKLILVQDKYNECFYLALNLDKGTKIDSLEYNSIPEWDSIGHMALISQIEDSFNISLDTNEVIDFTSYQVGLETLKKHNISIIG